MHIRQGPIVCLALALAATGIASSATARADQQKPPADAKAPPQPQPDGLLELQSLSQTVDGVTAGTQQLPSDIAVSWLSNHFIKSAGDSVYIPFTITVNRSQLQSPSAAMYVRVVSKASAAASSTTSSITLPVPGAGGRPTYPWDNGGVVEVPADGKLSRAIALPPGTYDAYVGIREKSAAPPAAGAPPAKMGIMKQELVVPAFPDSDLSTSSILLARSLETLPTALPPDKQQENPYVFGPLKVTPAVEGAFLNSSDLQVLFWIYGASHTGGKPDVQVEFSFHQRLAEGGEKYFNKTAPQDMNEKTLPPEFNLTSGHQLLSSLAIPLKSFPPGNYRLEVKVTDKPSGKNLTRSANFTVSAS
jgi:hypothetical protein